MYTVSSRIGFVRSGETMVTCSIRRSPAVAICPVRIAARARRSASMLGASVRISGFGHALYGISVAGLAILSLVYGDFMPIWKPFPASLPWRELWAYGSGAILLAASAGLFLARTAWVSAIIIGLYELVWAAARTHAVLLTPQIVGSWYGVGEALG